MKKTDKRECWYNFQKWECLQIPLTPQEKAIFCYALQLICFIKRFVPMAFPIVIQYLTSQCVPGRSCTSTLVILVTRLRDSSDGGGLALPSSFSLSSTFSSPCITAKPRCRRSANEEARFTAFGLRATSIEFLQSGICEKALTK